MSLQFMEVIDRVAPSENNEENLEELHKLFNEQGYSDYIVVFLVSDHDHKLMESKLTTKLFLYSD